MAAVRSKKFEVFLDGNRRIINFFLLIFDQGKASEALDSEDLVDDSDGDDDSVDNPARIESNHARPLR